MGASDTDGKMKEKVFFSIIIPCCDVEKYLRECLDSVLAQPFGDWECLLAVEESLDATEAIAFGYAARDKRFSVLTGPRSGSPATPRNRALTVARGQYVIFLDGDDTISPGALARLHDEIASRPGADLYPCAMLVRDDATGRDIEVRDNYPADFNGELTGPAATLMVGRRQSYPCPMAQLTICRLAFLKEKSLAFVDGLRHEDSEFTPRALYSAARVAPLHEKFYIYRIRANSVVTSANRAGYFNRDFAVILRSCFAFHAKVSAEPGFDRGISVCWAKQWLTTLFLKWFGGNSVAKIPRRERLTTLKLLFGDGFGDFNALLARSSAKRKLAGWWVKAFVRCAPLRPLAEAFFTRLYFPLADRRR